MSERAQQILAWLTEGTKFIRQQTLAEEFNCSRRTIGRALKELKEAGLLVDLNRRHENRCKMYQVTPPLHRVERGLGGEVLGREGLLPQAQVQWERYEKTFRIVFEMPDLERYYAQVTWELADVKEEMELWTKTWAGLHAIASA